MLAEQKEVFDTLLRSQAIFYIVVETKFTVNHFERLMKTCADRGRWKWIAEMKNDAWEKRKLFREADRSQVDQNDFFPRFYFRDESLSSEFFSWIDARALNIVDIRTPKI